MAPHPQSSPERPTGSRPSASAHFLSSLRAEPASGGSWGSTRPSQGQPGVAAPSCVSVRGWPPRGPFTRRTPAAAARRGRRAGGLCGRDSGPGPDIGIRVLGRPRGGCIEPSGCGGSSAGQGACRPGEAGSGRSGRCGGRLGAGSACDRTARCAPGTCPPFAAWRWVVTSAPSSENRLNDSPGHAMGTVDTEQVLRGSQRFSFGSWRWAETLELGKLRLVSGWWHRNVGPAWTSECPFVLAW